MGLPSQRNTTYGASTPVLSADLNAIQDVIVNNLHPEIEKGISGWIIPPTSTAVFDDTHDPLSVKLADNNSDVRLPLSSIPTCDRITRIVINFFASDGNAWELRVNLVSYNPATGIGAIPGTFTIVNGGAGGRQQVGATVNAQLTPGNFHYLDITPIAVGGHPNVANDCWLTGVSVKHDNL